MSREMFRWRLLAEILKKQIVRQKRVVINDLFFLGTGDSLDQKRNIVRVSSVHPTTLTLTV